MLKRIFRPSPPLPAWAEYGFLAAFIVLVISVRPPLAVTIVAAVAYVVAMELIRRIVAARSRARGDDAYR